MRVTFFSLAAFSVALLSVLSGCGEDRPGPSAPVVLDAGGPQSDGTTWESLVNDPDDPVPADIPADSPEFNDEVLRARSHGNIAPHGWVPANPTGVIFGRFTRLSDRSPASRGAPIRRLSFQVAPWECTYPTSTGVNTWKVTVHTDSRALPESMRGHVVRITEPFVRRLPAGVCFLDFDVIHKRIGTDPIVHFRVLLIAGKVIKIWSSNVRGADRFQGWVFDAAGEGINLGADALISWLTGGFASFGGHFLDVVDLIPGVDLHPYRGWEGYAAWNATQVANLYARALYARS